MEISMGQPMSFSPVNFDDFCCSQSTEEKKIPNPNFHDCKKCFEQTQTQLHLYMYM